MRIMMKKQGTGAIVDGIPSYTTATLVKTFNNPSVNTGTANDYWGGAAAIDGDYALISSFGETDGSDAFSGMVYVYNFTTDSVTRILTNPNPVGTGFYDYFGISVALKGNYALIGTYREDDDAINTDSGKAYIYDISTGVLLHTLHNPNTYGTSQGDLFGTQVAITGNYAIVTAPYEDSDGGISSGVVHVFNINTGQKLYTLDNPNGYSTSGGDLFGHSLDARGDYIIVGARGENDFSGPSSGKAYIFDVATGTKIHTLDNPNAYGTSHSDQFGWSVSIDGDYAIVGALTEDDANGNSSGKAYIFDVATGTKIHTLDNPNAYGTSLNDEFGYSVQISGHTAIVGAHKEDYADGGDNGKAYMYDVVTGTLLQQIDDPNSYTTGSFDWFGYLSRMQGNRLIITAPTEGDAGGPYSGTTYIYELS